MMENEHTLRVEERLFSCFFYTFDFYYNLNFVNFLLFSPEASSSYRNLLAKERKMMLIKCLN